MVNVINRCKNGHWQEGCDVMKNTCDIFGQILDPVTERHLSLKKNVYTSTCTLSIEFALKKEINAFEFC